jgi:hypothetical protein
MIFLYPTYTYNQDEVLKKNQLDTGPVLGEGERVGNWKTQ